MPEETVVVETPAVPSKRFKLDKPVLAASAAALIAVGAYVAIRKFDTALPETVNFNDSPFN